MATRARAGRYTQFEMQRGLPIRRLMRWFDADGADWVAKPELTRLVTLRRHNLVADRPPAGAFDVILCRNVLLYLSGDAKAGVFTRFAAGLLEARKLNQQGAPKVPIHVVVPGVAYDLKPFGVEFVPVAHSIPESTALAIRTCGGQSMLKSLPLERMYRDSRCGALMRPYTSEIMEDYIGVLALYEMDELDNAPGDEGGADGNESPPQDGS